MNKNILQSIQLSSLRIVELKYVNNIEKNKTIITDELNDDIIYKNIILKNRYALSYFIEGYLTFIDNRDGNDILSNVKNDKMKKLFLEHFQPILENINEIGYPEFFHNLYGHNFQDDVLLLINDIDVKLFKIILDNYVNGNVKISIHTLYEKINEY